VVGVGGLTRGCPNTEEALVGIGFDHFQGLSCRCLRGEQYTSRSAALQPFFDAFCEKSEIVWVGPIVQVRGKLD